MISWRTELLIVAYVIGLGLVATFLLTPWVS